MFKLICKFFDDISQNFFIETFVGGLIISFVIGITLYFTNPILAGIFGLLTAFLIPYLASKNNR